MTGPIARVAAIATILTLLGIAPADARPPTIDPAFSTVDELGALVAGATGFQPPSSSMARCLRFHAALPCARASQSSLNSAAMEPTVDELATFLSGSVGL